MPNNVTTCPKCGALITPQLVRCRQCKHYLHGTQLEGFVFESLLPQKLAGSPGTGMIAVFIGLYYALMVMFAGPSNLLGFSGYTLQQLGATHVPSILMGEHWRFVTSIFGHHDLVHLAFNLWALAYVGPIVEELFDRKKMLIIYLLSGTASMVISHFWYLEVRGSIGMTSAGASGAVCGLIGAALIGARRLGPQGADMAKQMGRWSIYMVVWGLVMPGINNAAHLGGFAVAAALAGLVPVGLTQTVAAQKVLSVLVTVMVATVIACVAMMLLNLRGFPGSLQNDAHSKRILFFQYADGAQWEYSDQKTIPDRCLRRLELDEKTVKLCELARRVTPRRPDVYEKLAMVLEHNSPDAKTQVRIRKLRNTGALIRAHWFKRIGK